MEDEACGLIKAYNLQPAITTTEPALIHARIIPLMSEFKDWQRTLAYVQPLKPEAFQELKVRIRHITRFTNKKLAGIFKGIDLSLPKNPPAKMILARLMGIGIKKVTNHILLMSAQRHSELV